MSVWPLSWVRLPAGTSCPRGRRRRTARRSLTTRNRASIFTVNPCNFLKNMFDDANEGAHNRSDLTNSNPTASAVSLQEGQTHAAGCALFSLSRLIYPAVPCARKRRQDLGEGSGPSTHRRLD